MPRPVSVETSAGANERPCVADASCKYHVKERICPPVVAVISKPGAQTAEELMVEADQAVYEAKGAGRDRFRVHEPAVRPAREVERAAG